MRLLGSELLRYLTVLNDFSLWTTGSLFIAVDLVVFVVGELSSGSLCTGALYPVCDGAASHCKLKDIGIARQSKSELGLSVASAMPRPALNVQ